MNLFEQEASPSKPMRDHQEKFIRDVREAAKHGHKRIMGCAAVGFGKTLIAANLFKSGYHKGKVSMFTVPRNALIEPSVEEFEGEGLTDIGIIQQDHPRTNPYAKLQVASIHTAVNRELPHLDFVIVDECFPAGTPILTPDGEVPIERLMIGDTVYNAFGYGDVLSSFKKPQKNTLKVHLNNGTYFRCTKDHPIFTERGWVNAAKLVVGERLFSQEDVRILLGGLFSENIQRETRTRINVFQETVLQSILFREVEEWRRQWPLDYKVRHGEEKVRTLWGGFRAISREKDPIRAIVYEAKILLSKLREKSGESNARSGGQRASLFHVERDKSQAISAGRERNRHDDDPVPSLREIGRRMGARIRGEHGEDLGEWIPTSLQARLSESLDGDLYRTGRIKSQFAKSPRAGFKERRPSEGIWVESVEVEKLASEEFVYNLRVSGHPSYFANGILVHNCHLSNKNFLKLLDSPLWADRIVIGLSATPWKRGMGFRWTKLIQTKKTAQLIEEGYLVKPRYLVGAEEPKTEGLKTHLDDEGNKVLSEDDEAAVMGDKLIIGDVVQTWLKHGENRPSFYYCVNLAHARKIRDEFEREGVSCGYVDGSMTREVRTKALRMYREGRFKIIVNYGVLATGIDEDVRCIGICRIIKSEIDWVQIIGRGLRTDNLRKRVTGMDPKQDCLVIDHGGNLTRDDGTALPPAEEIYYDYLDTTDPRSKKKPFQDDPKPATHRKCKKCGALIPPKTLKCPGCGDESFSTNSGVRTVDAEFHEFGKERPKVVHKDAKQVFYSELLEIARRRGYQDGWVAHTYRRKFNVWPRGLERVIIPHPRSKTWEFVQQNLRERAAELHKAEPVPETPVALEEETF
jgi:superfamily II DNA or RNA helicase